MLMSLAWTLTVKQLQTKSASIRKVSNSRLGFTLESVTENSFFDTSAVISMIAANIIIHWYVCVRPVVCLWCSCWFKQVIVVCVCVCVSHAVWLTLHWHHLIQSLNRHTIGLPGSHRGADRNPPLLSWTMCLLETEQPQVLVHSIWRNNKSSFRVEGTL